jgi:hypothetical protein
MGHDHSGDEGGREKGGGDDHHKHQPPWLALALAAIAVTAPITTAIYGWMSTSRELALNTAKQQHEVRLAYLDRAIDPNRSPADRQIVLRFLVAATAPPDPIRAWAERELGEVNGDIERLTKQRDQLQATLEAASTRLKSLEDELAKAQSTGSGDTPRAKALSASVAAVKEHAQQTQQAQSAINAAIGKPDLLLTPKF